MYTLQRQLTYLYVHFTETIDILYICTLYIDNTNRHTVLYICTLKIDNRHTVLYICTLYIDNRHNVCMYTIHRQYRHTVYIHST